MKGKNFLFDPAWLMRATEGQWLQQPSVSILRICHDTRRLAPGDLYVAIRGAHLDGHSLVAEAFQKGAAAAMVDEASLQTLSGISGKALLVVSDTVGALGRLAAMHRHRVGALITGITGSVGKTTVKEMTAALLSQRGPTTCTKGNWNNHIGLPLSMLSMERETRFGIFEIGMNHPGEIRPLAEILTPDWAVITTIGPVHLENFSNVEGIAVEKAALLRALPHDGAAFLHRGDPYFAILQDAVPCSLYTLGLDDEQSDADMHVRSHQGNLLVYEGGSAAQEMPLPGPGRHHVVNAGLAVMVARAAGCSWEQIRKGFSAYRSPPMRWEIQPHGPFTIVNDAYNANPISMKAALETYAEMLSQGHKWLVLGDMLELGGHAVQAHKELGAHVAAGDWAGMIAVGLHAQTVREAALRAGMDENRVAAFATVSEAGDWLRPRLSEGDSILLKGSRGVQLENLLPFFKRG